jgi:hypothetical protein
MPKVVRKRRSEPEEPTSRQLKDELKATRHDKPDAATILAGPANAWSFGFAAKGTGDATQFIFTARYQIIMLPLVVLLFASDRSGVYQTAVYHRSSGATCTCILRSTSGTLSRGFALPAGARPSGSVTRFITRGCRERVHSKAV